MRNADEKGCAEIMAKRTLVGKGWRADEPTGCLRHTEVCRVYAEDGRLALGLYMERSLDEATCEITDEKTWQTLWVRGIPGPDLARWLFKQCPDLLMPTEYGASEYMLELESGKLISEDGHELRSVFSES